jgi:putative endonuclease
MNHPLKTIAAFLKLARSQSKRDPLGPAGERAAARMLRKAGFRVLARNVHVSFGELDLLCLAPDKETIVGVEVKSRRVQPGAPHAAPPPEASVHAHKRHKVHSILKHLAKANGWNDRPVRMDAVAVEFAGKDKPIIRHYVNVSG